MSIVCGTDFSETAAHAATVAAALAARTGEPLHLVHAVDLWPEEVHEQPGHPLLLWSESHLSREAERLRKLGANVQTHLTPGATDQVVQTTAREVSATLIVLGAVGRHGHTARLGSRSDRTAEHAHVPVLAVRDSTPFTTWLSEGRMLRIVLGIDASQSAEAAAQWVEKLCQIGPCELVLAHLYWPPEAYHRLGLGGLRSFVEPDAELVTTLERQFSERFDRRLHAKVRTYRIEPHLGRVGDGLAALAAEAYADLLVVGCHAQGALERIWEGSVSRQALRAAHLSVACVPAPAAERPLHAPKLGQVLAATDFSELGNAAVPLAYATAAPGGTVHLLHVVKAKRRGLESYDVFSPLPDETNTETVSGASARLSQLMLSDPSGKSVSTRVHVLEAPDPSVAICQAAERLGVDLICLGTHGRTGLAQAALGSVAAGVLAHTRRPLLLARSPKR